MFLRILGLFSRHYLAVSIWLLDYFNEHDLLNEVLKILPSEYNSIGEYRMPPIKDSIETMKKNRVGIAFDVSDVVDEDIALAEIEIDSDTEITIEKLQRENKQQLLEIKELRAVLKKERHEHSNINRKLEKQSEIFSCEHDELVRLREAIFNFQQEVADETLESNITFPYKTQGKICVVGGNIPWLKAIKTMLPNVRFISTETAPNQDIIKNADAVWIQVNSLPHGYFYGIINIVRTNKIPLKYFGYSGVKKCAEQLVSEEENEKVASKA